VDDLTPSAVELCLTTCLAVRPGESVTLVTDDAHAGAALALARGAEELGARPVLLRLADRHVGGKTAPGPVDAALAVSDVAVFVLLPEDGCQLWHTPGRQRASEAGARIGLLFPPSTWDLTEADLLATKRLTDRLADELTAASTATLRTAAGTDLTLSLAGRPGFSCHSLVTGTGATATIPEWGDAEIGPVEGTTNGTLVIDASIPYIGVVAEPIRMRVVDGLVTTIEGGAEAARLREILDAAGPTARNIAELGIGTIPRGGVTGHKDDKLLGTVHVALGHNRTLGGTVDCDVHLDGVMHRASLELDGAPVLVDGTLADPYRGLAC
jgi:leucyl aminopeptidase (aminopeptidase T)